MCLNTCMQTLWLAWNITSGKQQQILHFTYTLNISKPVFNINPLNSLFYGHILQFLLLFSLATSFKSSHNNQTMQTPKEALFFSTFFFFFLICCTENRSSENMYENVRNCALSCFRNKIRRRTQWEIWIHCWLLWNILQN